MPMITKETRLKRKENIPLKKVGDESIILDLDSGDYFALNEAAGFIWERLDGRRELGVIARELARTLEVSLVRAVRDTKEFAVSLIRKKLVRIC